MKKKFLVSLSILFLVYNIFAKKNDDKKIFVVEDRPYRTIGVSAFTNKTGFKDFDFLAPALEKRIASFLKGIDYVPVNREDFVPLELSGRNIKVVPSTNIRPLVVVLSSNHNIKFDWTVSGCYALQDKNSPLWNFTVYLTSSKGLELSFTEKIDHRKVLENVHQLVLPVRRYFSGDSVKPVFLKTDPPFYEIKREDEFLGYSPLVVFLEEKPKLFKVVKDGNVLFETNLSSKITSSTLTFNITNPLDFKVKIKTIPSGAKISIDESFIGFSPLTNRMKEGLHLIQMEREGYIPKTTFVEVFNSKTFSFKLMPVKTSKPSFNDIFKVSLVTGVAATLCGVGCYVISEEYIRQNSLKDAQKFDTAGDFCIGISVPFFVLSVWSYVRDNEQKDW